MSKNEEEQNKYYTWIGLKKVHDTYKDANKELNANKKLKGCFPAGFESEQEAEEFRTGKLDEYIAKNYKPILASAYDAVIYTDGSWDGRNETASYGILIFFRGETEPYMESATLKDINAEQYQIIRYDSQGKEESQEIVSYTDECQEKSFVSASQSAIGELWGARRALEICCQGKG